MILAVGSRAIRMALVCVIPHVAISAGITAAGAQTFDRFTVSDIAIDATADTAIEARGIALANGQRDAFEQLVRRLTLREYYPQIPRLDNAGIATIVQGIQIGEEKTSSKRYLAKLTVRFKQDSIRGLLRGRGIPFSETPSKPLLVLPIYEAAGARNLWDDPNPWWAAWEARARQASVVPFVIPIGDLADVRTLGANQALSGDSKSLAALYKRYQVEDILVAHAVLRQDLAAGIPRLTVTMHRHGPDDNSVVVESFSGVSRTMVDVLLERAANEVAAKIEEGWKRLTLLRFDDEGRLSARIPLSDLSDWVAVRSRLSDAAEISRIEILEISREAAQVALHYFGSPQQLAVSLAQRDLDLVEEEGYWLVRLKQNSGASAGGDRKESE